MAILNSERDNCLIGSLCIEESIISLAKVYSILYEDKANNSSGVVQFNNIKIEIRNVYVCDKLIWERARAEERERERGGAEERERGSEIERESESEGELRREHTIYNIKQQYQDRLI